ncbi:co-chaperone GroES [Chromobacterium violaceum]|uniref:co-chaperone GroES n=1 Tax=Chromobacterium violaceum TaxID=536 RepID=UPI0015FCA3D5|nr:co-chaperone GroES [Chromobacterium violaceum]MBA8736134.1 co-chaperone GroES [Chromobacterium violaceum]
MQIRPLHDRIIVKRVEKVRQTASGIVIPDSAAEKPEQGEVLAVGPGKRLPDGTLLPMQVQVGDLVLFGKYGGQTVKLNDQEYLVLREEDVFGIVEDASQSGRKAA